MLMERAFQHEFHQNDLCSGGPMALVTPAIRPRILILVVSTMVLLSLPLSVAPPAFAQPTYIPVDLSLTVFRDGSVAIQYSVRMLQPSTRIPLPNFDPYSTST